MSEWQFIMWRVVIDVLYSVSSFVLSLWHDICMCKCILRHAARRVTQLQYGIHIGHCWVETGELENLRPMGLLQKASWAWEHHRRCCYAVSQMRDGNLILMTSLSLHWSARTISYCLDRTRFGCFWLELVHNKGIFSAMTIMPEVLACLDMAVISRLRNVEIRPEIAGEMGRKFAILWLQQQESIVMI